MNLRTLFNLGVLAVIVYGIFCGYQYMQLRNAVLTELQGKAAIRKVIGSLQSVKVDVSQYPPVTCGERRPGSWWNMVLRQRSEGCYRLVLGLQSDTLKTLNLSVDYDSEKLVGERISYVMMCRSNGEVIAKDNGLPRDYQNCQ